MAISDAMRYRMNTGGSAEDLYATIRDFLATNPDAAATQAAMAQYGISGEDVANATGGKSGGLLSGNILSGASWNSLNKTLGDELTAATGQTTSNYAVGGATTADTLNQLNTYLAGGGQFDSNATVFLQTGGVDFLQGVDKGTIKDNINQIVKTLGDQGVNVVLTGSPYAASINDVVTNNFDPKVDPLFNEIAKENKNVALVGVQGEILQNKKLLVDALHTNAEGTAVYNQAVIDSLSQFKNDVPSSTPDAIKQVQTSNVVATTPAQITQIAQTGQSMPTNPTVQELIKAGNLNPTQIAQQTGLTEKEVLSAAAATISSGQSITLGDTVVQPQYRITGSGQTQEIGGIENIYTTKVGENGAAGTQFKQYSPTGEFQTTGTNQKVGSFLGGLVEAFNDPVVQAAFLGLGGGGALGNALGLTGSTAQAVGTGLFKGGTALAGGADFEDALKTGLLSGGLVYGGNALNNYLTTGTVADPSITERAFATLDAKQLADQGLTATQIRDTLSSGGYNDITIERALSSLTGTPVAVSTPVTDTSAVNITAPSNVSLSNVLSTIAAAPVAVSTPVTDGGTVKVTGTSEPQMTTQQAIDLVNSQLAANVTTPANLANVQVTAPKITTTQDLINTIAATLPVAINTPVNTRTTPEIATQTITAKTPTKIGDTLAAITTIPSTLTTTPVTSTTTTTTDKTKETDPIKVAQLALAAAGLLGAGTALSNTGTPTGFDIVPIPETFLKPPAPTVAPFTPLSPINFGNRNLLRGTQWEKFLDPNYGKVPEPVKYSQPSNLSYNDLMGILGSRQGMPPASSLSINDIISGIQNQYGQAPTRTMG